MKSILSLALIATTTAACITSGDDPEAASADDGDATVAGPAALAGPIRVFKHSRSTRGSASLTDPEGTLSDADIQEAPDAGPFVTQASAGVGRGNITAAGVTIHDSSFGGRLLALAGHCDANANIYDAETEFGSAQCGNEYEVAFELLRPIKAAFSARLSSARTGLAGGWGEVSLYDGDGVLIDGIVGDNGELDSLLVLAPGSYKLVANGSGGATATDIHTFSAATMDVDFTLTVRNY